MHLIQLATSDNLVTVQIAESHFHRTVCGHTPPSQHVSSVIRKSHVKHQSFLNVMILSILIKVLVVVQNASNTKLSKTHPSTNNHLKNHQTKLQSSCSHSRGNPGESRERFAVMAIHNTWQLLPDFLLRKSQTLPSFQDALPYVSYEIIYTLLPSPKQEISDMRCGPNYAF